KRGLSGLTVRPVACLSSRAHARDLARASGSHEVVWGPNCPLVGSLDVFASRDDHARYLTLYIYRSPRAVLARLRKIEAEKREFLARFCSATEAKLWSLAPRSKIALILKFP